jgi:hypothetical protein
MTIQETLTLVAFLLAPAFFSLLGMGALGSPAIAFLAEISAKTRSKVFIDKYGQQTASMGLILIVALILIYAATLGLTLFKFPHLLKAYLTPGSPFYNGIIAFGVFAVSGLTYCLTWKKLRNSKGMHMALGGVATLSAMTGLAIVIPAKLALNLSQDTPAAEAAANAAILALPMSAMYALLVLSAAAALSLVYMIIRRNKDDFGRDYYNFSLRLAARWAVLPMIGFLGCQGWVFARLPENLKTIVLGTPLAYVWAGLTATGAVCAFIWIIFARSESPLRLKGLAFLAVGLFWLMHALNATLFVNFMTMM